MLINLVAGLIINKISLNFLSAPQNAKNNFYPPNRPNSSYSGK